MQPRATLLSLSLASFVSAFAASPVISGHSGLSYAGLRNTTAGQDYFLGIPFAKPPVGALRFKPPVPWSSSHTTVLNATSNGFSCEQGRLGSVDNAESEDCLTLNIWKPTNVTGKIPVMVWIYGGSFYLGDIQQYPGNFLVERSMETGKPVIYVAMNYRLGLFGFPPGQAAADAGALNLGLKDQRLALEWVQKNIGYFGGDSSKVTIFGTSVGAISAAYQSFYKGGKIGGAFRSMILSSGSPTSLNLPKPNDPVMETAFQMITNATGCTHTSRPFECVRNAPSDVLSQANKDSLKVDPYYTSIGQAPAIYGATTAPGDDFFPDSPRKLLHQGKFAKVPFINGDQLDEGPVFINGTSINTEKDIINWLGTQFPGLNVDITNLTLIQEVLRYYPASPAAGSPYGTGNETFGLGAQYKRFASLFGDLAFNAPRRDHLRTANKFGVKAWLRQLALAFRSYILSQAGPGFVPQFGVRHGADIPFVMQTVDILDPNASPEVVEIEHTIGDYWVNFVYNLDPNPKGQPKRPHWPRYGSTGTAIQLLAANVTAFEDSARTAGIDFLIDHDLYN
ncbi:alpha/beta-hydrolase [Ceratobasidium sp. AG-I]|nr:alpha/beta-hydrolase [Ceratobasidium sp. AG-I]